MKPHLLVASVGMIVCSALAASAAGTLTFQPPVDFSVSSGQAGGEFGDLNGDGKPDAVAANYWNGTISVYRNTSTAGIINSSSLSSRTDFSVGGIPHHTRIVDLDGDGKLDIVVVNQGSSELSLLRNIGTNGVIQFAPAVNLATAYSPYWVAVGDLNGDGKADLIVSCYDSGALSLIQNNSTVGNFSFGSRVDVSFAAASASVEVGDIDGDGKIDVAVAAANTPAIWIYRNVSTGGALTASSLATRVAIAVASGSSVALADIDGDGKLDIVAPSASENLVSVLRNTSTPGVINVNSFAPRVNFPTGGYPYRATTGNLDNDQRLDIVIGNADSHTVTVYRNLSTPGSFTTASLAPRADFATGTGPRTSAIADIDGDGLADIATANLSQNSFSVLRQGTNTVVPPPPPPPVTNGPPGLISLWHAEGNAQDAMGNNHGILRNGAGFAPGVVGQGFFLDGVDDYIRVLDSPSLQLANEFTLEMWFKRENSSSYGGLIDKRNWTSCNFGVHMSADWVFHIYFDDPSVSDGNQYELSFSAVPSPGVFHHFAATFQQVDASHVEMKTYMDGALVRTDTRAGNLANSFNNDPMAIGTARDGLGGSFFHGIIDEVAIYNYALSATQVSSNFNSVTVPPPPPPPPPPTPGLVSLWHGDGDAQDAIGNNHGILRNGAGFTQGVSGQGFLLDGVDDYIRVLDAPSLHLANEFSLEMWFKRADSSSYGGLIDKRNWTSCNFGVHMSGDWDLHIYFDDPNANDGRQYEMSFSPVPAPGVFHHFVATFRQVDGSHVEMKTYMDGQLVRTDTRVGNLANSFNNDPMAIGTARDGLGGSFFHGVIDEVAIYNYAISATQVSSNYASVSISIPPQIVTQPASVEVIAGQPATFTVLAAGSPTLRYQWRLAGGILNGETNSSLTLPSVQSSQAGAYNVVVANLSGSVTSAVATLTVSASGVAPSFVVAPATFYAADVGQTKSLTATVAGTPPFLFQWTFDGISLPGATNLTLILSNVQPENAGTYRLFVTNSYGSLSSLGSTLNVGYGSGGTFHFANTSSNKVLNLDGMTGVPAGTGYVAAIYIGVQSNSLAAAGGAAGFIFSGRFHGGSRTVPSATAGQTVFAQVRVWDLTTAASYDEAITIGAKHGASTVFEITLGGGILLPGNLNNMPAFSLEAGNGIAGRRKLQSVASYQVSLGGISRANGLTSFIVSAPAGSTLAIEASTDLATWDVIEHIVNNTGAVKFVDETEGSSEPRFYRARVVSP